VVSDSGWEFDIVIVGGGMVGCALARALSGAGYRLALIESTPVDGSHHPSFDTRTLALAAGSQQLLERLGVWSTLAASATPIRQIQVSDRGHFGGTRLDAAEEGVAAFGQVVGAAALGAALTRNLDQLADLTRLQPATLQQLTVAADRVTVTIQIGRGSQRLSAALVVAADGGESAVAAQLGLKVWQSDYQQSAIVAQLVSERPHRHIAYERFTDSGPLALLPDDSAAVGNGWSLVWTAHRQQEAALLALNDGEFLRALQHRFGRRVGTLMQIGTRTAYPLRLRYLPTQIGQRVVVVGNAAHTIHPVGGQGFNLGLRDASTLARLLRPSALRYDGRDWQFPVTAATGAGGRVADAGEAALLRRYQQQRRPDQAAVIGFSDLATRLFSNQLPPLVAARGGGLLALALCPSARHRFARRAMGLGLG